MVKKLQSEAELMKKVLNLCKNGIKIQKKAKENGKVVLDIEDETESSGDEEPILNFDSPASLKQNLVIKLQKRECQDCKGCQGDCAGVRE